jgi:hypothetical protein
MIYVSSSTALQRSTEPDGRFEAVVREGSLQLVLCPTQLFDVWHVLIQVVELQH